MEPPHLDMTPEPLGPLRQSCAPVRANRDREGNGEAPKAPPLILHVPSPPPLHGKGLGVREEEKEGGPVKMEVSSYSCQAVYPRPLSPTETEPEIIQEPARTRYPSCIKAGSDSQEQMCASLEQTTSTMCEPQRPDTPVITQTESVSEAPLYPPHSSVSPLPEDPMAGMLALLTASEMAQARPGTPPAPTLLPQTDNPPADCSSAGPLEMVALEGMALLSQMAQQEMEHISQEKGERSGALSSIRLRVFS